MKLGVAWDNQSEEQRADGWGTEGKSAGLEHPRRVRWELEAGGSAEDGKQHVESEHVWRLTGCREPRIRPRFFIWAITRMLVSFTERRNPRKKQVLRTSQASCDIWDTYLLFKETFGRRPIFYREDMDVDVGVINGLGLRGSLEAQTVKNLFAVQKTQVWSLGWEDPLEKETATYSSILAWRIPWTEEPSGLTVHGVAKSQTRPSAWHFSL